MVSSTQLVTHLVKEFFRDVGGVRIVGEVSEGTDLVSAMCLTNANTVIAVTPGDSLPQSFRDVIQHYRELRLVAISADGDHSAVYQLSPRRDESDRGITKAGLLEALGLVPESAA